MDYAEYGELTQVRSKVIVHIDDKGDELFIENQLLSAVQIDNIRKNRVFDLLFFQKLLADIEKKFPATNQTTDANNGPTTKKAKAKKRTTAKA